MANSKNSIPYSPEDVVIVKNYLSELIESVNSPKTVLTTHKRTLFADCKHDTLIFDEDPLNSLLEIKSLEIP